MIYTIASLYYEEELSQSDVAQRLGISSATVSRHLRAAREQGIVRISVHKPATDGQLAGDLREMLGLRRVELAEDTRSRSSSAHLAAPLARVLEQIGLSPGSIVAVGWGQTAWDISQVKLPPLPDVTFVPASGGIPWAEEPFQTTEIVRRMALSAGAHLQMMHAPYLPSIALRRSLASDPEVSRVAFSWDHLSAAIVGVGMPYRLQQASEHLSGRVAPEESDLADAAGDVLLHYLDDQGVHLPWPREDQLLSVTLEQLRATRDVIGVACGAEKARGVVAAARGGAISTLVTDRSTARDVLALLK